MLEKIVPAPVPALFPQARGTLGCRGGKQTFRQGTFADFSAAVNRSLASNKASVALTERRMVCFLLLPAAVDVVVADGEAGGESK